MKNIFYAQSGGVTAVINATAAGLIEAAREEQSIHTVYAGINGILGALEGHILDTAILDVAQVEALKNTPAGAFGSCRFKLPDFDVDPSIYDRIFSFFEKHQIGAFCYNGGNDSMDTVNKISKAAKLRNIPLQCLGLPKTIDNDLPHTDQCPGFGSVAKYIATSIMEAGLDVASMAASSTKVFILEVMGRHAGWIAAASGLASRYGSAAPDIILLPEVAFDTEKFLRTLKDTIRKKGSCAIVISEGVKTTEGNFLSDSGTTDSFGHHQLGGAALVLAEIVKSAGFKVHYAIADYLQRSARHLVSHTDFEQAYALGHSAVQAIQAGETAVMLAIRRLSAKPYQWDIVNVPLSEVANIERGLPPTFIREDGLHITDEAIAYLEPLIEGEHFPPYHKGLPQYIDLRTLLQKQP